MRKKIFYLIIANLIFAALVVVIVEVGYEYDKAYKLYPEMKQLSYDLSMRVYGERWVRFVKWSFVVGFITNAVLVTIWLRKRFGNSNTNLSLDSDDETR